MLKNKILKKILWLKNLKKKKKFFSQKGGKRKKEKTEQSVFGKYVDIRVLY